MATKRTLTAEGVLSVRIPSSIPFKTETTDQGLLLITGESNHTHELLLKLLEQAEFPRHDNSVQEILVEAQKIVKGGTTILEVHSDGLKPKGCSLHPVRFVHSQQLENRMLVENVMFDPTHDWNPKFDDSYELRTGELSWDKNGEEVQYKQPQRDGQASKHIASLSTKK